MKKSDKKHQSDQRYYFFGLIVMGHHRLAHRGAATDDSALTRCQLRDGPLFFIQRGGREGLPFLGLADNFF